MAEMDGWVRQFQRNLRTVAQQEGSVLAPYARQDYTLVGSRLYWDKLGTVEFQPKTRRGGIVPTTNQDRSRRSCTPLDFELALEVDKSDMRRQLTDPRGPKTVSMGWAAGRKWDALAYAAMIGSANDVTTTDGGTLVETAVPLPTAQIVVNGSTNLTLDKINAGHEIMDKAEIPKIGRVIAIGANQRRYLSSSVTEFKSWDYSPARPLEGSGRPATFDWNGLTFVQYESLTVSSSIRQCVMWHPMYFGMAILQQEQIDAGQERLLGNNLLIYGDMSGNGARIEDVGVVRIDCLES